MTNAPFSKVVETCLDAHAKLYVKTTKDYITSEMTEAERDKLWRRSDIANREEIIAAHEADLREALEKLVAPHYDDWHQAYDYNRIAESVLAQLSPEDKKGASNG